MTTTRLAFDRCTVKLTLIVVNMNDVVKMIFRPDRDPKPVICRVNHVVWSMCKGLEWTNNLKTKTKQSDNKYIQGPKDLAKSGI
jgi:hypothetical protein